jgi:hypothetical protein
LPDYRSRIRSLESIAAYRAWHFTNREESRRMLLCFAGANLFPVLGVQPLLGCTFTAGAQPDLEPYS